MATVATEMRRNSSLDRQKAKDQEVQMANSMPLDGVRVLDLATVIAGPLSSTLLADFGADVIKIELPNGSDGMRALPPFKDGVSLWQSHEPEQTRHYARHPNARRP